MAHLATVGPVHVENFPDGEAGVARAKAEIFDGLEPGGVAVLNADNGWFDLPRYFVAGSLVYLYRDRIRFTWPLALLALAALTLTVFTGGMKLTAMLNGESGA